MSAFWLDKWYMDLIDPTGQVLIVYLARVRLPGLHRTYASIDLFPSDGSRRNGSTSTSSDFSDSRHWLRMDGDTVRWNFRSCSGELTLRRRAAAFIAENPLLRSGDRALYWSVEVPDADAEASIRFDDREIALNGRGYRDRVTFDVVPWRFPIRELRWGRLFTDRAAATFVHAVTTGGSLSRWWASDASLDANAVSISPCASRTLIRSHVLNIPGIPLKPIRPLLRAACGDPFQVKWLASEARLNGFPAEGIHELVVWS